jgi:hypothetical protein
MSTKRNVLAVGALMVFAASVITVRPPPTNSATPGCGTATDPCISIFSRELGTYDQPNVVEAVLDGVAVVGQPVILAPADGSDPSQDFFPRAPGNGTVSDFYAVGMVSAEVNSHYGSLPAAQIEYAPNGVETDLCAGVAVAAFQNQGLTLVPCNVPGRSVWILDFADSPTTAPAWFPIVSASTTDFAHPFAMTYPQDQYANPDRLQQILVRRLQFVSEDHTLRDTQLWGAWFGPLPAAD